MFDIKVERVLDKPIEAVFEAIIDHENYKRFPGIKDSELIEKGNEEKNGLGALRKIDIAPFQLYERIVAFERPTLMEYRIEKSAPIGFAHELGQIKLSAQGDKTRVTWTSKGRLKLPLLGPLVLDPIMQKQGGAGFGAILKTIEKQA